MKESIEEYEPRIDMHRCHLIPLSGTINGVTYQLGVPNPLNHRNPAPLDERHLPALRTLLGFVDSSRVRARFSISEAEFTRRFPAKNAWTLLVDLLICWVRTDTAGKIVDSHFASASFEENFDGSERTAYVTFGEDIIPVVKGMIHAGSSDK